MENPIKIIFTSKKEFNNAIDRAYRDKSLDWETYNDVQHKLVPIFKKYGWATTNTAHVKYAVTNATVRIENGFTAMNNWKSTMTITPTTDLIKKMNVMKMTNPVVVHDPAPEAVHDEPLDLVPEAEAEQLDVPDRELDHGVRVVRGEDEVCVLDEDAYATVSEDEVVTSSTTEHGIVNACLLPACIRCMNMVLIQFKSMYLPSTIELENKKVRNALVVTVCKSCLNKFPCVDGRSNEHAKTHEDAFKIISMHPDIIQNSKMMKIASKIVGETVSVAANENGIICKSRDAIKNMIKTDTIMRSLDMTKNEYTDTNDILLPYLMGDFL